MLGLELAIRRFQTNPRGFTAKKYEEKKKSKKKRKKADDADVDEEKKVPVVIAKQVTASDCVWSASQELVVRFLFRGGRSCFISGGAGTGKSRLLQYLIELWNGLGARFDTTASTGTAAFALRGTTLHRFVGVPLAEFEKGDFSNLHPYARERIRTCRVMILDEVSIISDNVLDKVSLLMQQVRGNYDQPFGGVAMILSGDFCQLRPVEAHAGYAFQAHVWDRIFTTTKNNNNLFFLEEQFRQKDDARFTHMLNHVRSGIVNQDVDLYFQFCELNLDDVDELQATTHFTYLAPLKSTVEKHNQLCHQLLVSSNPAADVRCYGPDGKEFTAGSRAMITENVDVEAGLVNGRCATVVSVADPDALLLKLDGTPEGSENVWLEKSQRTNQVPVQRAWGFTVHKAQGQTYANGVLVNAREMPKYANSFSYGQFYVAASRAKCRNGFAVTGWNRAVVHADPVVLRWYAAQIILVHRLFPRVTELSLQLITLYYA